MYRHLSVTTVGIELAHVQSSVSLCFSIALGGNVGTKLVGGNYAVADENGAGRRSSRIGEATKESCAGLLVTIGFHPDITSYWASGVTGNVSDAESLHLA